METTRRLAPWGETDVVGKPLPRVDGYQRVSGSAVYPHDLILPEMLYAAILRCPHANHARAGHAHPDAAAPGAQTMKQGQQYEDSECDACARSLYLYLGRGSAGPEGRMEGRSSCGQDHA